MNVHFPTRPSRVPCPAPSCCIQGHGFSIGPVQYLSACSGSLRCIRASQMKLETCVQATEMTLIVWSRFYWPEWVYRWIWHINTLKFCWTEFLPWCSLTGLLLTGGTKCPTPCGWANINKSVTLAPNSRQSEHKTRHSGGDAQGIWKVCGEKKKASEAWWSNNWQMFIARENFRRFAFAGVGDLLSSNRENLWRC